MSKGVDSVSTTTFPAAAVMDELSMLQLAMVLAVMTVLVLLLVALALVLSVAMEATVAASRNEMIIISTSERLTVAINLEMRRLQGS
jgi:hypothetical protein